LKLLGISEKNVRLALKPLLKAYENNWTYIEEENYRVLIDAIFDPEEPMVLDKPEEPMVLDKPILRFNNEEPLPDFNLYEEPDEEDIEPLRKKPRTRNTPSVPAGSSVPCASEMQQMVEHDFRAMDILAFSRGFNANLTFFSDMPKSFSALHAFFVLFRFAFEDAIS
nr:probable inactive histone-lysine N-methyltransferase SUVR1 isoform X2 [Tanacetum cinerariifolium]